MIPRLLRALPWPLLRNVLILTTVGLAFIYSATFRGGGALAVRQLVWFGVALLAFLVTVKLGYRFFLGMANVIYLLALAGLGWVLIAGEARLGAQRWIELGFFSIQPSELTKLGLILALATSLGSRNSWEEEGRALAGTGLLVGIPLLLILKQPDLGTAVLLIPLAVTALFLWGIRYRYLIGAVLAGLFVSPVVWNLLKEYQKKRILVFLNPESDPLGAGYTAIQSRIAVGAGGLFGKGWLHGTQSQLEFVPEHHTDFIVTVIAEELGFVGTISLVVLYGALFFQMFHIIESTTDTKARILGVGVLTLFFFQVLVNVGMSFGLFPITGVPLPFLSYGGSSLVVSFIAVGLLASIYRERSIF